MYNSSWVKAHFDKIGIEEAQRLFKNPEEEMKFEIHKHYLKRIVKKHDRVLEIGAGPGVFTKILHEIGARIIVTDISEEQIKANKEYAKNHSFTNSIDNWQIIDICDLSDFKDNSFDHIIAYGGPISYVFNKADLAVKECFRVLKPNGYLLSSVMSLWGSINTSLFGVLSYSLDTNLKIIETGDLSEENLPSHNHFCKLYTASKLNDLLIRNGFSNNKIVGSSFLTTKFKDKLVDIRENKTKWDELIQLEILATANPGSTEASSHMISISQKFV